MYYSTVFYMQSWSPVVGQALRLKRETANAHDVHAVAIYFENQVVRHVPYNLAPTVSAFLRREVNKGSAEVTVDKVPRDPVHLLSLRSKTLHR